MRDVKLFNGLLWLLNAALVGAIVYVIVVFLAQQPNYVRDVQLMRRGSLDDEGMTFQRRHDVPAGEAPPAPAPLPSTTTASGAHHGLGSAPSAGTTAR